jgi:hypothetical protein
MRTKSLLTALVLGAIAALLSATVASAGPPSAPEPSTAGKPFRTADADVRAAGPPTFNYRELWLLFPSTPGGKDVCQARDIKLAAGWYYWRHEDRPYAGFHRERTIYLDAGWYHWKDCLGGWESVWGDHHYYHDTYLRQSSTGGTVYLKRSWILNPDPDDRPIWVWGQFGSSLRLL